MPLFCWLYDSNPVAPKAPIQHMPTEVVDAVLGWLDDRDFWRARQAHRTFRLAHPPAVMKERAFYWWARASPEEALRRQRADIFLMLHRRKRIPPNFDPWPWVMMSGDVALFDAVRTVVAFPASWYDRRTQYAIERGHLALVLRVRASYPDQSTKKDFVCAVRHHQSAIAMAMAGLGTTRPHRLVEYAAYYGCVDSTNALFGQHGSALSVAAVIKAAASNGQVGVLHTMAPFVEDQAIWADTLFVASARGSVVSVRWIMQTVQPSHEILARAVRVASAHGSTAVVDTMLRVHPDLAQNLTDTKCTLKDGCVLLRSITSKFTRGSHQACWSCL